MNKHHFSQPGQALILITIGIVGLIGLVALAIDGGNAFMDRRRAQNAVDTAAMAAAYAKIASQDPNTAALNIAYSNGYVNDGVRSTVTYIYPPSTGCKNETGPYAGNPDYLQVVIHSYLETFFAQVVGISQIHNCVEAISNVRPPYGEEAFWGNAVVSLNPDGCMSFDVGGTSQAHIQGGGVFVNSANTCGQGAFRQHGASLLDTAGVCVNGSWSYDIGAVNSPPTHTGCSVQPYPPEWLYPDPQCTTTAADTDGDGTWTPGNIAGSSIGGHMVLSKGVYCIDGNVRINSTDEIKGDGVLLFVKNGSFTVNGGATVQLTAPTSLAVDPTRADPTTTDYIGLLIYLPLSNNNPVEINGNSISFYKGTILAPASLIRVNGFGNASGLQSQIIGYDIELIGTADLHVIYNDAENYDVVIPPAIELVK